MKYKHFVLGFFVVCFYSRLTYAACPQFGGNYVLTFPPSNFMTKFSVTQSSCDSLKTRSESDGVIQDRLVTIDGKPHVTFREINEVITETFKWSPDQKKISYRSEDNYVWGERYVNIGEISKGPNGEWIEVFSQYRWTGEFLYTT